LRWVPVSLQLPGLSKSEVRVTLCFEFYEEF
jgi:hypothetical protein